MAQALFKSTAIVGGGTLVSRVLGFVRDVVLARVFGADGATDAFFVAFKIPNFMRRLFAEGAFAQAFVPVLAEQRQLPGNEPPREFVARVAGTLGAVLFVLTVLGVLGAALVISLFAPGFADEPERFGLAVEMLRLTFPYLLLISLVAFAGGILNSYGRFAVPAITPVLLNVSLISAALWLAPQLGTPIVALAWGVLFAGLAQLLFQLPSLRSLGLLVRPRVSFKDPGVRKILRLMAPALFGVSVTQINLLIDTILASFLVAGSVSWLYYSDRLMEFPLGVFGVALGTVILPSLSRKHVEKSLSEFSRTLDWALRWVFLLIVPAALGLFLLAEPILLTLFYSTAFDAQDVASSAGSLQAYSLGLVGFTLIKVLAPGYFARQDTKTPVKIGVVAMLTNIVLNLILIWHLQHVGLALATSIAAWVNAGLLYIGLRRGSVLVPEPGWLGYTLRVFAALAVMAAVLLWLAPPAANWLEWSVGGRAMQLAILIAAGVVAYFVAAVVLGLRLKSLLLKGG